MSTIKKNLSELIKQGVRIRFVGDRALFPEKVLTATLEIEEETKWNYQKS